jgi:hypothetical protein
MSNDRMGAEQRALRGLLQLMEQADECRKLYERANMALPEPLKRILGISDSSGARAQSVQISPPPEPGPRPAEATADWLWIDARSATPTVLVLALLRVRSPRPVREVIEGVQQILPDAVKGSINNIGTRLDNDGLISRDDEGWWLIDPDSAGILSGNHIWGPPSVFGKPELASHRRDAITHLLGAIRGGLQAVQILEHLKTCSWLQAPLAKELIQDDIELLAQQGKIRKRGNSRKWELS